MSHPGVSDSIPFGGRQRSRWGLGRGQLFHRSRGVPEAYLHQRRNSRQKAGRPFLFEEDNLVFFQTAHLGWSSWKKSFQTEVMNISQTLYIMSDQPKKVRSQRSTDNCQGESSMICKFGSDHWWLSVISLTKIVSSNHQLREALRVFD